MVAEPGSPADGAASVEPQLHDVAVPRPPTDVSGVLFVLTLIGSVTCLSSLLVPIGLPAGVPPVLTAFGMIGAVRVLNQYRGARAITALRALGNQLPADAKERNDTLARLLMQSIGAVSFAATGEGNRVSVAATVAELLTHHSECGRAYRFATPRVVPDAPGPPFHVPFEPVLLDVRSPALRALRGDDRSASERFRDNLLRTSFGRWGRTRWGARFVWLLVAFYFLLLCGLLISMVIDMLQGRVPHTLIWFALPLGAVGLALLWRLWHPQQWFVVPGAVVVGASTWRSARWTLEMFRADEGVLVYWADAQRLAVATRDGRSASIQTPAEVAEVAIRAWLSSLEPPPLEQFSDLT